MNTVSTEDHQSSDRETLSFQTEVRQVLDLMAHALYSNKEVFLRELISNASDAADKLRFEALSNDALYEGDSDLKIHVAFDKEAHTVTVSDNGIGMSRDEVVNNVGTIARSGTREFLKALSEEKAGETDLIGQFGVGFYSSFVVADKVDLTTRRAGLAPEEGVLWSSSGEGSYTLETVKKQDRGTEITLHLREEEEDFLNQWRLQSIIRKFSDHINFPIQMLVEDSKDDKDDKGDKDTKKEETVNQASALWTRPKSDISESDYEEFYKHVSHDFEGPLTHLHSRLEGKYEYTLLLYIPKRAPFDLWDRDNKHGLKLYVRRIFILEGSETLTPRYLRFVRGVVDSADLPLNVSREMLQNNRTVEAIKKGVVGKVFTMLEELASETPENYAEFWKTFGQVLKEGVVEDFSNRDRLAKLLRFSSTYTDAETEDVTLQDYVSRMKEDQEKIYYATAETFDAVRNSPHLEIFRKKEIEVLLLSDRIDEWVVTHLTEFDGKSLQSVATADLDLGKMEDKAEKKALDKTSRDFEGLTGKIKQTLEDRVKDVRLTNRLTDSPVCLVSESGEMGGNMERILKASGQDVPDVKPILELNPEHTLVSRLKEEKDETKFSDWCHLLLEQALLSEGGTLKDPASFVRRLNGLLTALSENSENSSEK